MLVRQGLIKNSPFLACKQICNVNFGNFQILKFYAYQDIQQNGFETLDAYEFKSNNCNSL